MLPITTKNNANYRLMDVYSCWKLDFDFFTRNFRAEIKVKDMSFKNIPEDYILEYYFWSRTKLEWNPW